MTFRLVTIGSEKSLVIAPGELNKKQAVRWLKDWASQKGFVVANGNNQDEATAVIQEIEFDVETIGPISGRVENFEVTNLPSDRVDYLVLSDDSCSALSWFILPNGKGYAIEIERNSKSVVETFDYQALLRLKVAIDAEIEFRNSLKGK